MCVNIEEASSSKTNGENVLSVELVDSNEDTVIPATRVDIGESEGGVTYPQLILSLIYQCQLEYSQRSV